MPTCGARTRTRMACGSAGLRSSRCRASRESAVSCCAWPLGPWWRRPTMRASSTQVLAGGPSCRSELPVDGPPPPPSDPSSSWPPAPTRPAPSLPHPPLLLPLLLRQCSAGTLSCRRGPRGGRPAGAAHSKAVRSSGRAAVPGVPPRCPASALALHSGPAAWLPRAAPSLLLKAAGALRRRLTGACCGSKKSLMSPWRLTGGPRARAAPAAAPLLCPPAAPALQMGGGLQVTLGHYRSNVPIIITHGRHATKGNRMRAV